MTAKAQKTATDGVVGSQVPLMLFACNGLEFRPSRASLIKQKKKKEKHSVQGF